MNKGRDRYTQTRRPGNPETQRHLNSQIIHKCHEHTQHTMNTYTGTDTDTLTDTDADTDTDIDIDTDTKNRHTPARMPTSR